MKRKILVTTGTRAEYGILRPILNEIKKSRKLELILVVTGTHLSKKYGYSIKEIKNDEFFIHAKISMIPKSDTNYSMSIELGKGIVKFTKKMNELKPDINLVLGDRDEMLASAISASHLNIPNAHIHGGDISGGIDEYNRHAITKLSNIHFTATKKSKERVIKMGENSRFVFNTGSPSIDEIKQGKITTKEKLGKKYHVNFKNPIIVLVQHPVTTETNKSELQITQTLNVISKLKINTIAIAPNSDAGRNIIFQKLVSFSKKNKFIKIHTTLPREDYLGFLKNCNVLIGNSSSGIVEASYFNTPVINLGLRQKGRERVDAIIDIEKPTEKRILLEIMKCVNQKDIRKKSKIYGNGSASKKIIKILEKITIDKNIIQKQFVDN